MQKTKFVMRIVGKTDKDSGRISAEEFEDYLDFNFLSKGFKVFSTHADPVYENSEFKGYRVFVTLLKE